MRIDRKEIELELELKREIGEQNRYQKQVLEIRIE